MKKILVTRKLLKSNEEKLKKLFDVKLNSSDELYSQEKLIKMRQQINELQQNIDRTIPQELDLKLEKVIGRKAYNRRNNLHYTEDNC